MSQAGRFIPTSGPGSGTVTSITFNGGLTSIPDPVTTTGTATIDQTNLTVQDGTVYWDTGTQLLHTTATGTAGQVLTSNGAGMAPSYQNAPATGIVTINGDTGSITGTTVTIKAGVSTQNSGSSVQFTNSVDTSILNVTDANHNTLIGNAAGNATLSGTSNVGLGYTVLNALTSGVSNVAVGALALSGITSGTSNVAIGNSAGSNYTSSETDNILIGQGVTGTLGESNITRIGTGQSKCFISGIDGVNVASTAQVVTEHSNQLGTAIITAGTGISVTPGANTITIAATGGTGTVTGLKTQDGNTVTPTAGVIQLSGGNSLTTTGTSGPNTATISLTGITQYNIQSGGASNALNNIAPSATSGVPLISQGSASQPIFGTALIAGGGTASTSFNTNGVIISGTGSTSALTALSLTSGQIVIGGTSTPAAATLTPGTGITIVNGNNSITISASGSGFTWNDVTGGSATMAAENGYIADSGSLTTLTMPTNSSLGDTIKVVGKGSGGWKIVYGALQNIIFGSSASTATTGNIASTNANDCVELVCTTPSIAAPIFTVVSSIGNISIT